MPEPTIDPTTTVEPTTTPNPAPAEPAPATPTPSGEPTATPAEPNAPKTAEPSGVDPSALSYSDVKYYSQLDKETASNKDLMERVKGHKTVSELAKAYAEMSAKMDDALFIPGKDATVEQVKDFFHKIGVPKKSEDYNLVDGSYKPEEIAELKTFFRNEVLYKNGLSKVQGERVWKSCLAYLMTERAMNEKAFEKLKSSFSERHSAYLKNDYPVDADRQAVMNEDLSLASEFFSQSGLGKAFKDTGLIYNPEIIHKAAQYQKGIRANGVMGTSAPTEKDTGMFQQGEDFKKAYGGRK